MATGPEASRERGARYLRKRAIRLIWVAAVVTTMSQIAQTEMLLELAAGIRDVKKASVGRECQVPTARSRVARCSRALRAG